MQTNSTTVKIKRTNALGNSSNVPKGKKPRKMSRSEMSENKRNSFAV